MLIIKVGSAPPDLAVRKGDFEHWFAAGLGLDIGDCRVIDPREGDALPSVESLAADGVSGVVVTGSSAMVTHRADWSVRLGAWLPHVVHAEVPLLAVCYGHQLLAEALGGQVKRNPHGRQIGTIEVDVSGDDPLLSNGRSNGRLRVQATHVEAVVRPPPGAVLLARSSRDPHQAFRHRRAWGVQFHPEMDAETIRYYVDAREPALQSEGLNVGEIRDAVEDTPDGITILRRFTDYARSV